MELIFLFYTKDLADSCNYLCEQGKFEPLWFSVAKSIK